jgi:hypothetical protein
MNERKNLWVWWGCITRSYGFAQVFRIWNTLSWHLFWSLPIKLFLGVLFACFLRDMCLHRWWWEHLVTAIKSLLLLSTNLQLDHSGPLWRCCYFFTSVSISLACLVCYFQWFHMSCTHKPTNIQRTLKFIFFWQVTHALQGLGQFLLPWFNSPTWQACWIFDLDFSKVAP